MHFNNIMEKFEHESLCFFTLCSQEDKKLLLKKPEDKTIEDFVRFICLGMTFDMRGAYLKLFAEFENVYDFDDIFKHLNRLDFNTVEKWLEEFIDNIEDSEIRETARQIWTKKKNRADKKYFKFQNLV